MLRLLYAAAPSAAHTRGMRILAQERACGQQRTNALHNAGCAHFTTHGPMLPVRAPAAAQVTHTHRHACACTHAPPCLVAPHVCAEKSKRLCELVDVQITAASRHHIVLHWDSIVPFGPHRRAARRQGGCGARRRGMVASTLSTLRGPSSNARHLPSVSTWRKYSIRNRSCHYGEYSRVP